MSDDVVVSFTVNGAPYDLDLPPRRLLSDALRHDLRLTGTHVGCEHGALLGATASGELYGPEPVRGLPAVRGTFERMSALLEARNLTRVFGSEPQTNVALDHFSLTIDADVPSFTAITGESGSGKTTLARLLLGFTEPTSGEVIYRGKNLGKWADTTGWTLSPPSARPACPRRRSARGR